MIHDRHSEYLYWAMTQPIRGRKSSMNAARLLLVMACSFAEYSRRKMTCQESTARLMDACRFKPGRFYQALKRLEDQRLIDVDRKEYPAKITLLK